MNTIILTLALLTQTPEILSSPREVYINQQKSYCWARQVVQGSSDAVGKWRVLYRTNGPSTPNSSDPYGFTSWLNGVRATYGLGAVYYDGNLAANAAVNSAKMAEQRALLHTNLVGKRQNSAMGNYASIGNMWLHSPAHREALLHPGITRIGLAGYGIWWTLNLD